MRRIGLIVICLVLLNSVASYSIEIGVLKYKGGDWYSCLPAVRNFIQRFIRNNPGMKISLEPLKFAPDEKRFFSVAFYVLNGHGQVFWNDAQIRFVRIYLENGGFIFVNDDYGMDLYFRKSLRKIFSDAKLVELSPDHPIFTCFYRLPKGLPKIHKHKGGAPRAYALFRKGRMVLFYAFNTDIVDGWDLASVHKDPAAVREAAYRMGANILFYAMTR